MLCALALHMYTHFHKLTHTLCESVCVSVRESVHTYVGRVRVCVCGRARTYVCRASNHTHLIIM